MNFAELIEAYLETLRVQSFAAATVASRRQGLRAFAAALAARGLEDVREVTREHLRGYAAGLLAGRSSAGTVRVRLAALRAFFAHLETRDAILLNPCAGLPSPRVERSLPKKILSTADVRRILAVPDVATKKGRRDKALLELLYSSALRLEELTRLSVHDLDLRGGFVRVERGKGGRGRIVPIGEHAAAALRAYLAARLAWLRVSKKPQLTEALWLSPIQPHHPLKKEAVALIVRRSAARAGLARSIGPHAWRHTCATHLVRDGANLAYVQRLLGHRRIKTTEIYTRVTLRDVRRMLRTAHPRSGPDGRRR